MRILVANRGEIACRVLKTLAASSIESVSVYSEPDSQAPHVWMGDQSILIGGPKSYLDCEAVLDAAKKTGATAIHPGYGFLAENAEFAQACNDAGINFIGPSIEALTVFADKRAARRLAMDANVPVIAGAETCDTPEQAAAVAAKIGYPVLVKAAGGGGGKGMRLVNSVDQLEQAYQSAAREAKAAFNDDRLLVEKYIFPARHVEVQILGDGTRALVVGDRECSLQRRYQKVIEEAPCTAISAATRHAIYDSAKCLMEKVGYLGAGTVEFLVGPDESHYFLEVNTRLQVEHPVTELITGMDLVAEQISLAHGGLLPVLCSPRGHAIEARLNAEDAYGGYLPQSGEIAMLQWPQLPGVRVDSGILEGGEISTHYDSMIAKVIAWGATREQARVRLIQALRGTTLLGLTTNQSFLIDVLESDLFKSGDTFTTSIESACWESAEAPEWALELGQRELEKPNKVSAGGELEKVFSPWTQLGPFRIGE